MNLREYARSAFEDAQTEDAMTMEYGGSTDRTNRPYRVWASMLKELCLGAVDAGVTLDIMAIPAISYLSSNSLVGPVIRRVIHNEFDEESDEVFAVDNLIEDFRVGMWNSFPQLEDAIVEYIFSNDPPIDERIHNQLLDAENIAAEEIVHRLSDELRVLITSSISRASANLIAGSGG